MSEKPKYYQYLLAVIFLTQCKEHFEANLPVVPQGYLVVEGFINAQGATQIKLSRTVPLDQNKTFKAELNAMVQIQGENNTSYGLTAIANGNYASTRIVLNPAIRYRLHIKTKDNKEYVSEYVQIKITPPIDSISWKEESDGIPIYVNTHDDQNKTVYYRWEYDETWEIHSAYYAAYHYVNGRIIERDTSEPNIFYCWKYDTLKNIILESSEKLEKDIINLKQLAFIPIVDERIGVRYSIQVRQYALDKEGYQFYELMKKNTESLGTIFDPQPSAVTGNVHSVSDPNEIVIGYIGATTMQQQRIFIDVSQILVQTYNINRQCYTVDVPNIPDSLAKYIPPAWPYQAIFDGLALIAYKIADHWCVDCRARGGNVTKPSFW